MDRNASSTSIFIQSKNGSSIPWVAGAAVGREIVAVGRRALGPRDVDNRHHADVLVLEHVAVEDHVAREAVDVLAHLSDDAGAMRRMFLCCIVACDATSARRLAVGHRRDGVKVKR